MNEIKNIQQLNALITETYIWSVIFSVVFIFFAILISGLIRWEGGGLDKSYIKRRISFLVLGFICSAGFYVYKYLSEIGRINNVAFQSKFTNGIAIAAGIIILIYFAISILLMKWFPKSKFGSILSKKDN